MRKKILIALLIGAVTMTAACSKPAKDAAAQAAPTPEPKKTVEAFGTVEANQIENISLDVEAAIDKVNVKEGQRVKKGDVLLSLNLKEYLEKIKGKQHEISIVRLEAEKMETKAPNPDIEKLTNNLNFANEQLANAIKEQGIQEKLYNSGAISKSAYDEFVKSVDAKRKNAEDIKYDLDGIIRTNELGSAIQNERAASLESEIRQLKEKLNKSFLAENNIICPVDNGIVYELGYKAGDVISSSKKVLSVMNLDTMVVKANVAEEFIKDVKLGAKVEIIPVADKSKQYKGKVTTIAGNAVVQNGETVIPVEISIDDKDSFLLPNFNVDVKIYMQ